MPAASETRSGIPHARGPSSPAELQRVVFEVAWQARQHETVCLQDQDYDSRFLVATKEVFIYGLQACRFGSLVAIDQISTRSYIYAPASMSN